MRSQIYPATLKLGDLFVSTPHDRLIQPVIAQMHHEVRMFPELPRAKFQSSLPVLAALWSSPPVRRLMVPLDFWVDPLNGL